MRYLMMIVFLMASLVQADVSTTALEGKILTVKNGKEKVRDEKEWAVVRRNATDAYRAKMARLKELEEENARLKARAQGPVAPAPAAQKRDSLSLLVGASTTALKTDSSPTSIRNSTDYEPELGAMYQHDWDKVRGTIGGTLRGNVFLGAGFKF